MLLCGELTCIRWGARVRINVQTDCHTICSCCVDPVDPNKPPRSARTLEAVPISAQLYYRHQDVARYYSHSANMASRALNDEEVLSEMNKMVCYKLCYAERANNTPARARYRPLFLTTCVPGCVHQAGGTGKGSRDQGQGRWRICHWEGADLLRPLSGGLRSPNSVSGCRLALSSRNSKLSMPSTRRSERALRSLRRCTWYISL